MTNPIPGPVEMPSPDLPDIPPVEMPTVSNDGPPVEMPTWPRALCEWPEETVEQIRLAETAHQRSVCHIPDGELPDDLALALERRIEVNLAQYDGKDIVRVGSKDPEVRELEAPFTRRRAAGSIDHIQEGQS